MVLPEGELPTPSLKTLGAWRLCGNAVNSGIPVAAETTAQEIMPALFFYLGRYDDCMEQLLLAENSDPEPHIRNMILLRKRQVYGFILSSGTNP
jgi:hypothetical protein